MGKNLISYFGNNQSQWQKSGPVAVKKLANDFFSGANFDRQIELLKRNAVKRTVSRPCTMTRHVTGPERNCFRRLKNKEAVLPLSI